MVSTNINLRPYSWVLTSSSRINLLGKFPSGKTPTHWVLSFLFTPQCTIFHKALQTPRTGNNDKADQAKQMYIPSRTRHILLSLPLFPGGVSSPTPTLSTDLRLRRGQCKSLRYTAQIIQFSPVTSRILLSAPSCIFNGFPTWTINYMVSLTWGWLIITMKQVIVIKALTITSLDYCINL